MTENGKQLTVDDVHAMIRARDADARENPYKVHVFTDLVLTLGKPTYADNFGFTITKPDNFENVLGVTGCFIRPLDGSFLTNPWYVSYDLTQKGNIRVLYMTGLAVGSTYKYSLSVVGV